MKIALFTSMKYGLTQFTYRDVSALVDRGHEVELFSLITSRGLYQPHPSWTVHTAGRFSAAIAILRLMATKPGTLLPLIFHSIRHRALRDLAIATQFSRHAADCDLLFSYFGDHKLLTAYYVARLTDVPLSVTVRAYELYRNPNPRLFRQALEECAVILTITEHNRRILEEVYGAPSDRIRIVRQIVDLDDYRPSSPTTILIVGFFAEKKGHETLFRAVRRIDRDVEVWVVGEDTPAVLGTDVRGLADELGVSDRVAFFGAQSGVALRAFYRECDIFCLPSNADSVGNQEGFPNVIAEAMAFGKPVVSTRHAGIPEAVDDAFLVDERDDEALAALLTELVDDPGRRREAGRRNRERARQMFSSSNSDDLETYLREAASSDDPDRGVPT